ncbi:MAG: MltA domain-containing protein [Syntrophobacterales bacterium]|nr:MltA domain-containing protein [Syntrophobacterales bacterium]
MISILLRIALLAILFGAFGCVKIPEAPPPKVEKPPSVEIKLVKLKQPLTFKDEGDLEGFIKAARESIDYFERFPPSKTFKVGEIEFSAHSYGETLRSLLKGLEKHPLSSEYILSFFNVYTYLIVTTDSSNGESHETGRILATGYYEPILEGSLTPSTEYSYPIYPVPENLVRVSLEAFNLNCGETSTIVGRVEGNKLVPYYTRREIDEGALKKVTPLVWVKDPLDAFFLQVQGSGIIRFPDGSKRRLGYGSGNGRPYRSIGKYIIDQGWIPKDEVTMQSIKTFLSTHPEKLWKTLWYNENYVFFRWVEEGPKGSLNVFLTPERSVASDRRYYPPGIMSFLSTMVPDNSSGLKPFNRLVFHQDAGGAIKGPSRIDIFFGSGDGAGEKAGKMKYQGTMFLFLPK